MNQPDGAVGVAALVPECEEAAREWARRLGLPFGAPCGHQLQLGPDACNWPVSALMRPGRCASIS